MKVKLCVIHNEVYLPIPLSVIRGLDWKSGDEIELDIPIGSGGKGLLAIRPDVGPTHMGGVREIVK